MNAASGRWHTFAAHRRPSVVVMMAAGAQMHSGGILRGCMHSVKRTAAPAGVSRIMYYQAWYGPGDHRFQPPPSADYEPNGTTASAAETEQERRIRSIADPIINSLHNRTSRSVLHDFRRQFQRHAVGNERAARAALRGARRRAVPPRRRLRAVGDHRRRAHRPELRRLPGVQRLREAIRQPGSRRAPCLRTAALHNPHMRLDGQEMDVYMRRRRNLSLDEYNDDIERGRSCLGYRYDNSRRINPKRAHLARWPTGGPRGRGGELARARLRDAVARATAHGRVYERLARRY